MKKNLRSIQSQFASAERELGYEREKNTELTRHNIQLFKENLKLFAELKLVQAELVQNRTVCPRSGGCV